MCPNTATAEADGVIVYDGGKHWAGFNPVTHDEGCIFIVEAVLNRMRISPDELVHRLPHMLAGYGDIVAQLLPNIADAASILYRPIVTVILSPPWC